MFGQRIAALALCSLLGSAAAVAQTAETSPAATKAVETAAADTSTATTPADVPVTATTTEQAAEPAAAAAPAGEASPAAAVAKAAEPAAPPPPPTLTVSIDLGSQTMTVSENGDALYSWAISSGTAQFPTPRGTFRPQWTAKMWYSRKYDMAPMPHAVFIHGGVAVHATQHVSALGSPASHGCIRLAPANARTFYNLVHRHGLKMTRVAIHGTPKFRAPAIASRKKKVMPQQYAQDSGDWWFSGPSYYKPAPASAYNPNFVKKQKLSQAQMRAYAQGKKVAYRLSNGQIVYVQRPPKVAKYGGFGNGGW